MKKTYQIPKLNIHYIKSESSLLVTSGGDAVVNTEPEHEFRYSCPHLRDFYYCERYSRHMNEWRRTISYAAARRLDRTFLTASGCIYQENCEIYHLAQLRKAKESNGK